MYEQLKHRNQGAILMELRKNQGKTQADVAGAIKVDPSRISRIEKGASELEVDEAMDILAAIGGTGAEAYRTYLLSDWEVLVPPPFGHPSLDAIWEAERALQQLQHLKSMGVSSMVAARLNLLQKQLTDAAEHLRRLDYTVTFIGPIGVGKTTLITVLTDLVMGDSIKDASTVLETGRGRTTLCDVIVEKGHSFGLEIEPYSSDEVYDLARDFCEGEMLRVREDEGQKATQSGQKGVSEEVSRALRCMAGMPRPRRRRRKPGEPRSPQPPDPIQVLLEQCEHDQDTFIAEFCNRLKLPQRILKELWLPDTEAARSLEWLAEQYREVNNGRNPRVSLPRRIYLRVPRPPIASSNRSEHFEVTVVDTKGVEENAIPAGLHRHRDDGRTLLMICSRFEDAPGAAGSSFIKNSVEEGGKAHLLERGCMMILVRDNEAAELKDDAGFVVEGFEEGYDLRSEHVEKDLVRLEVPGLPLQFADAARKSDLDNVRNTIFSKIDELRRIHARSIQARANAVRETEENLEREEAEAAHARVRQDLQTFANRHRELPKSKRPIQERLLADIKSSHARTVWATTRRRGIWHNLHAPAAVGAGAVVDARARSLNALRGLREILEQLLAIDEVRPAHGFVESLKNNIPNWEQRFLSEVREAGKTYFRESLIGATGMWRECERRYGQGSGYRGDVANTVGTWFTDSDRRHMLERYEAKLLEIWARTIIAPIEDLVADG